MKIFLLNIILLFTIFYCGSYAQNLKLTDEQKNRATTYAKECTEKEGITMEQYENLKKGHFENVDNKMKCFANCFLEKNGYMVNGEVQEGRIKEMLGTALDADQYKNVMTKCHHLKGNDNCDTAFKVLECYCKEHSTLL